MNREYGTLTIPDDWEYFSPGPPLAQTVEDVKPVLIFKDRTIKYPDDDKDYRFNYSNIANLDNCDTSTGVWSGYTMDAAPGTLATN